MNKVALNEILEITSSKRIHAEDYVDQGIPFYRSKEVIQLSQGEKITEVLHISLEQYSKIKSKFPVPVEGDILLTSVGTIGIPYYVTDPHFYFKDGNLTWFRNFAKCINSKYLLLWMQTKFFLNQINNNNIGAVQKALTIDFLKKFEITLPPTDTQQKIVSVISAIDSKIELNNRINTQLEEMAKTLYDYWFVQFEFPDVNNMPYKASGGKMIWNKSIGREIPEGWGVDKIGNIFHTSLGGTPSTSKKEYWENGNINWLNSGEIANFPIIDSDLKITAAAVLSSATELLPKGSVLLSITRHLRPTVLAIDACANQSVVGIKEKDDFKYYYLYPYLKNEIPRLNSMRTGAQQPHINKEIVDESFIVIPNESSNILKTYNSKVGHFYELIINNALQNQKLSELRDWLLPMLMNGQVKVQ